MESNMKDKKQQAVPQSEAERFAKAENIEITPATKLELKAFYGGNKYYLFVKTVYSDIRQIPFTGARRTPQVKPP